MSYVLCCDFDGTLRQGEKVSEENLEALKTWRENGHVAAIITGRNYAKFQEIFPDWQKYVDYLITDNGGATFSNLGTLEGFNYFEKDQVQKVLQASPRASAATYYYTKFCSSESLTFEVEIKIRRWYATLEPLWEDLKAVEAMNELEAKALPWPRKAYSNVEGIEVGNYAGFIDFVPAKSGKEDSIKQLLESKAYRDADVIVVGDDYNDIAMIRSFGGYAIESGCEAAKEAAEGNITRSVADLVHLILGEIEMYNSFYD